SSVATIPRVVWASRTSKSPRATRRIAPGGRSATSSTGTNGRSSVPTAWSSGGNERGCAVSTASVTSASYAGLGLWLSCPPPGMWPNELQVHVRSPPELLHRCLTADLSRPRLRRDESGLTRVGRGLTSRRIAPNVHEERIWPSRRGGRLDRRRG